MSNNLRPDLTPPIDLTIHQLAELRGAILAVIDEGRLVNGKREPWSFYPPTARIGSVLSDSGPTGDWHMDESGDSNLQRTEFCDEVQAFLMKKIVQG